MCSSVSSASAWPVGAISNVFSIVTAANAVTQWYGFREALPAPTQDLILRNWNAWLMPDRETEMDPKLRRQCDSFSGKLVHPMVDDPRVGKFKDGKKAVWNQGDTYYKKTGDWRGNKSFFRSGFTYDMSTQNFNTTASAGALLAGALIGGLQGGSVATDPMYNPYPSSPPPTYVEPSYAPRPIDIGSNPRLLGPERFTG